MDQIGMVIPAHVAHLHLVRDVPMAMTAQFSNSTGGMTRSFSTVHVRSRTTKPRPARLAFRQRANVAPAFGHDALAWAKYLCQFQPCELLREQ
jgi:hypothetical protein